MNHAVTYGYARVSKTDRDDRNLETQLVELKSYGIRESLIYRDIASGRTQNRAGWQALLQQLHSGDRVVVVWLDRFSRSFTEGVIAQAKLTEQGIGIVSLREQIDTSDDSAAAQLYQRMMLAQAAYQVESTSERIRAGMQRAATDGRRGGRPPAMTKEQAKYALEMLEGGASISSVARVIGVSRATITAHTQKLRSEEEWKR